MAINEMPDYTLTVIGDGKEIKNLKRIAQKNIKFTGHLEHSQVIEEMKKSDIFILPSVNETFGMTYLEAMTCGCITVGIENEGIDGIIKNEENGFLIKPNKDDIKNVLDKISNFNKQQLKNILQNCYNTVICYNSAHCAEKYLENILKII